MKTFRTTMQTAEVQLFVKRSGKLNHRNVGQEEERERERETGRVKWKFSYGQGTKGERIFIR